MDLRVARSRPFPVWPGVCPVAVCIGLWMHGHGLHVVHAQPTARIAVVPVEPADSPLSADHVRDAVTRIAARHGHVVENQAFERAAERVRAGAVSVSELHALAQAQDLLDLGIRAYLAADIELARMQLERARAMLEPVLALPGSSRMYADTCLRLGVVLLHLGQTEGARELFARAAALDPTRIVDESWFAPDVVAAYRAAASRLPSVVVRVLAQPAAARVTIDDRDLGPAPVTVELSPGPHLVIAREPGWVAQAMLVHASPEAAEFTLALEPDAAALAVLEGARAVTAGRPDEEIAHVLAGLVHYAELDSVLLVASAWRADLPALIGQRCTAAPVRCTGVVEIRYPRVQASASAAAELWSRLAAIAPDAYTQPPRIASEPELWPARAPRPPMITVATRTTDSRCRACRSPWLWAGVGVALAAAGAIVFWPDDHRPVPVITVNPCQFGPCAP